MPFCSISFPDSSFMLLSHIHSYVHDLKHIIYMILISICIFLMLRTSIWSSIWSEFSTTIYILHMIWNLLGYCPWYTCKCSCLLLPICMSLLAMISLDHARLCELDCFHCPLNLPHTTRYEAVNLYEYVILTNLILVDIFCSQLGTAYLFFWTDMKTKINEFIHNKYENRNLWVLDLLNSWPYLIVCFLTISFLYKN